MSALHWVRAWGDSVHVDARAVTACGRRLYGKRGRNVRCGTSDRDFGCDPMGRCKTCWRAFVGRVSDQRRA